MQQESSYMDLLRLKKKLKSLPDEHQQALLRLLPPEDIEKLQDIPPFTKQSLPMDEETLFAHMHPSHFVSYIMTLTEKERVLFLSAMSSAQKKWLEDHQLSIPDTELPPFLQKFFRRQLLEHGVEYKHYYVAPMLLTEHPLNFLATVSFDQLETLIRFLGLHDVVNEWKFIVDVKQLAPLQQAFSSEELSFMKKIQSTPMSVSFSSIGLQRWQGNTRVLFDIIYNRGLNRLAKSLNQSSKALIWFIALGLPLDAREKLSQMIQSVPPTQRKTLVQQVLQTREFIESENICHFSA